MAATWKLVRQFGSGHLSGGSGVAVTPDNDLVVSDWQSPGQIKFFSRSGEFKYDLDVKQNISSTEKSKPWNVVVSPDEELFLTQQLNYVGVYAMNGICKNHFRTEPPSEVAPEASYDVQLWGLAIDNQGCLLVGDFAKRYISKHSPDGSHISSFKVNIAPLYIAVTPQDHIVISNGTGGCAQILDASGEILHTLQKPPDVGLKCCRNTWKITIFVKMGNLGQYREMLIFCQ